MEILNVSDSGVDFVVNKIDESYEVKVSISYNFFISFQKTWYRMILDKKDFEYMVKCLVNGVGSKHGNGSIWQANKMIIKESKPSSPYREIKMYRRIFILGFNIVPASLTPVVLNEIKGIKA